MHVFHFGAKVWLPRRGTTVQFQCVVGFATALSGERRFRFFTFPLNHFNYELTNMAIIFVFHSPCRLVPALNVISDYHGVPDEIAGESSFKHV